MNRFPFFQLYLSCVTNIEPDIQSGERGEWWLTGKKFSAMGFILFEQKFNFVRTIKFYMLQKMKNGEKMESIKIKSSRDKIMTTLNKKNSKLAIHC